MNNEQNSKKEYTVHSVVADQVLLNVGNNEFARVFLPKITRQPANYISENDTIAFDNGRITIKNTDGLLKWFFSEENGWKRNITLAQMKNKRTKER